MKHMRITTAHQSITFSRRIMVLGGAQAAVGGLLIGRMGWLARYLKEVDASDITLRFWQEIYDEHGKLLEVHEKYPVDKGHQKV